MKKNLIAVGSVFLVALVLVGLTFSSTLEEKADYILINGTEPKTLDPALATGQPEGRLLDALFEGLTYREPKTMLPTPGSAERWETSPDGRDWTFHMRPEAQWHDGTKLDAHDFVYSWRRFLAPQTASQYAYLLFMVEGAQAWNEGLRPAETIYGKAVRRDEVPRKRTLILGEDGRPQFKGEGILSKIDALLGQHAGSSTSAFPAKAWQALLDAKSGADPLRKKFSWAQSDVTQAALEWREGDVTRDQVEALREALTTKAEAALAGFLTSRERLGKNLGFWASDDGTKFHVRINKFAPYFLELTCFYPLFPVPKHIVEQHPDDWFKTDTFQGNGPFRFESWRVNQKIRLVRNDDHWDAPRIAIRHADYLAVENQTTMMNLFLTGEADWAPTGYPPELIDVIKTKPYYYANAGFIVYFYRFNTTRKPFGDARVRKALAIGFQRHRITDDILKKGDLPSKTVVPPGVPGYAPPSSFIDIERERSRFDEQLAMANRLLDEAGFKERDGDGMRKGFPTFALLYNTSESHRIIAEFITQEWKKNLGVSATPANQEWQSYLAKTKKMDYDVARAGWIGDYLDPNTFLDMWITDGGHNETGWSDPFYDKLISLAADMLAFEADPTPVLEKAKEPERIREGLDRLKAAGDDADARMRALLDLRLLLFREAEAILVQDAFPIIPIYSYQVSGLIKPEVEGFYTIVHDRAGKPVGENLKDIHPIRYIRTPRAPAPSIQER